LDKKKAHPRLSGVKRLPGRCIKIVKKKKTGVCLKNVGGKKKRCKGAQTGEKNVRGSSRRNRVTGTLMREEGTWTKESPGLLVLAWGKKKGKTCCQQSAKDHRGKNPE